jgi:PAS domain S-box-containing protein
VIFHDISALKQAEQALLRERMLLRTVIDNLPDRIYVKDSALRYLLVNQSDLRHRHFATDQAMLGKTAHDILPSQYADAFDAEDRTVIETGKPLIDHEIVMENSNGQKLWMMVNKIPLRDAAGKIFGLVGIQRDITEARQNAGAIIKLNAELELRVRERTAQLENTNKELESFAYSVSHDLRAPLRSIDGFSKALLEDCQDQLDSTALDYLRRVRAASQRMATLIDDLLLLSRITRSDLRRETTDLSTLADNIVSELRVEQPQRAIDFRVEGGIITSADAGLMRVALDNLLGNAWKFTAKQPKAIISFGVEGRNGQPVYFIRDNGAGFDMRYADKLFGAFQRLHREAEFVGTGVGLAIVQRIIKRHGGQIWAEAAVGKGATFFFTLG